MSEPNQPSPGDPTPQGYQPSSAPEQSAQNQPPHEQQQSAYEQSGNQQPGYQPGYQQQPPADFPGKTLGIVGLVLSFFTTFIGLIISIVALRQSKKAGFKNTPALVGVIIGIVTTLLAIVFGIVAVVGFMALLDQCSQLGPGVHNVNGVTVTCGG